MLVLAAVLRSVSPCTWITNIYGSRECRKDVFLPMENDLITEDDLQTQVCDFGFKTRHRNDLKRGSQVRKPSVICAMGESTTLRVLFMSILPYVAYNFTLVTVEHDDSVPPQKKMLDLPYLQSWYGWNVAFSHPKLHALPIGLNKGRHLERVLNARNQTKVKNGRVLANFKLDNNIRRYVWSQSKHWGNRVDRIPYDDQPGIFLPAVVGAVTKPSYYEMLSMYSFAICPEGLGMDTHRVWEALYLGVVPIVLSSTISSLYAGLPVVQLDNWNSFTAEKLRPVSPLAFDSPGLRLSTWVSRICRSVKTQC
jgi:hypothetical protein